MRKRNRLINKFCIKCKKEKSISEFNKDDSRKDGFCNWCKECKTNYDKNYYVLHNEIIKINSKNYRNKNIEYYITYLKEWKKKNSDYNTNWYNKNKENRRIYMRKYFRDKLNTDINFKLAGYIRTRTNLALKHNQKFGKTIELLGCSIQFLKEYLESKFTDGMTWDNHGTGNNGRKEWHIDHIKPLSKHNLNKKSEQFIACHYSNLQPLWADKNRIKSNKF